MCAQFEVEKSMFVETIQEKPTWKNIFGKKHCLVSITSFIEPIYTGEYAGNMLKFKLSECVLVPGLFDSWVDKNTGEVIDSFAILTGKPLHFVEEAGHDRSPIFLDQTDVLQWVNVTGNSNAVLFSMLDKIKSPKISIEVDRKLKKGWEKRI